MSPTQRSISLSPWPGTLGKEGAHGKGLSQQRSKTKQPKIPASQEDRLATLAAVDFFYKECGLRATLLARRIGWSSDVKAVLNGKVSLTTEHLEKLAAAVELSLSELLAIGNKLPRTRIEEFKNKFIELELAEKSKHTSNNEMSRGWG